MCWFCRWCVTGSMSLLPVTHSLRFPFWYSSIQSVSVVVVVAHPRISSTMSILSSASSHLKVDYFHIWARDAHYPTLGGNSSGSNIVLTMAQTARRQNTRCRGILINRQLLKVIKAATWQWWRRQIEFSGHYPVALLCLGRERPGWLTDWLTALFSTLSTVCDFNLNAGTGI